MYKEEVNFCCRQQTWKATLPVKGTWLQYVRNEFCGSSRLPPRETERKQYTSYQQTKWRFQLDREARGPW